MTFVFSWRCELKPPSLFKKTLNLSVFLYRKNTDEVTLVFLIIERPWNKSALRQFTAPVMHFKLCIAGSDSVLQVRRRHGKHCIPLYDITLSQFQSLDFHFKPLSLSEGWRIVWFTGCCRLSSFLFGPETKWETQLSQSRSRTHDPVQSVCDRHSSACSGTSTGFGNGIKLPTQN